VSAQEYKTNGTTLDCGNESSALGRKVATLVMPDNTIESRRRATQKTSSPRNHPKITLPVFFLIYGWNYKYVHQGSSLREKQSISE
jgi:hypothetical protein